MEECAVASAVVFNQYHGTAEEMLETMKEYIEENGAESDMPKGCYVYHPDDDGVYAYFNTHATGAAEESSDPICFASVEIARRVRCTAAGGTWTNDACVTR